MKKSIKKISALLIALILCMSLGTAAFADSSVDYQGGAEKFVFLEGSEYTDSDLFGGFKNVFPGDELEQLISVKNSFLGPKSVRIYMRAVPHGEDNPLSPGVAEGEELVTMTDFLSKLHLTVYNKDRIIFDAPASELDGLKENVLLGDFARGSSTELKVILKVPAELGNEYADRTGEVDWVFTAEEITKSDTPKTGDNAQLLLWISLAALSLSAVVMLYKKNSAEH